VLTAIADEPEPQVLVADDDPHVRRILGEALTAAGCEVRIASSGGEVIELVRRARPHALVLDLLMPGVDGLQAIAAVRADPASHHIHVVALVSREMADAEMERLSESVDILRRGRLTARLTPAILLSALERTGGAHSGAAT
jgi:two-component system, OmpR family, response regulator